MSDYLSAEEAASRAGVSSKTVRRWIESGRLKADKSGRSFRIDVNDLAPFIGHSEHRAARSLDTGQDTSAELIALVREQQQTIMELSGRLGFLQSELQQRDEQLKALQAPREEPESTVNDTGVSPTDPDQPFISATDARISPAAPPPDPAPRRWWQRILFG